MNFTRDRLAEVPPDVRADFARIALAAMERIGRRWTSRRGVETLWYLLDGDRVEVAPPQRHEFSPYAFDDIHSSSPVDNIERKIGSHRAVALVYGSGWRSFSLRFMKSMDTFALAVLVHRAGTYIRIELPFERVPGIFERLRFDEDLRAWLADQIR